MELSVIIVSYNVCDYLRESVRSVIAASPGPDTEIIIVDNDSSDGSASMVESEYLKSGLSDQGAMKASQLPATGA
jgi:glycosyltransferase involved in cell wall biosynthesis